MKAVRMLFVDDDNVNLFLISRTISELTNKENSSLLLKPEMQLAANTDIIADFCEGALSALETTDPLSYDVIFTDDNMPGITGMSFISILNAVGYQNKIFLLTSSVAIKWELPSNVELLSKPLELATLIQIINNIAGSA
ncbi:MAG: response regulator [Chitinophagaceae bacterium]